MRPSSCVLARRTLTPAGTAPFPCPGGRRDARRGAGRELGVARGTLAYTRRLKLRTSLVPSLVRGPLKLRIALVLEAPQAPVTRPRALKQALMRHLTSSRRR